MYNLYYNVIYNNTLYIYIYFTTLDSFITFYYKRSVYHTSDISI